LECIILIKQNKKSAVRGVSAPRTHSLKKKAKKFKEQPIDTMNVIGYSIEEDPEDDISTDLLSDQENALD